MWKRLLPADPVPPGPPPSHPPLILNCTSVQEEQGVAPKPAGLTAVPLRLASPLHCLLLELLLGPSKHRLLMFHVRFAAAQFFLPPVFFFLVCWESLSLPLEVAHFIDFASFILSCWRSRATHSSTHSALQLLLKLSHAASRQV